MELAITTPTSTTPDRRAPVEVHPVGSAAALKSDVDVRPRTDEGMPNQLRELVAARSRLIVTVDGPAAVGKGTATARLARRLGLQVMDTGKMYRAAAWVAIENRVAPEDHARLIPLVQDARIAFDWKSDPPTIMVHGEALGHRIGSKHVEDLVSKYAGVQALRDVLISDQRRMAREHPKLMCDGRDQGTKVFPDADMKFYLDASAQARARRALARHGASEPSSELLELTRVQIERRDEQDRANGALLMPQDAEVIVTDYLTPEGVVEEMERRLDRRLRGL